MFSKERLRCRRLSDKMGSLNIKKDKDGRSEVCVGARIGGKKPGLRMLLDAGKKKTLSIFIL